MTRFAPIPGRVTTIALLLAPALAACSPGAAPDDTAELPPPVIEGVWRASQVRHEAGLNAGSHSLDVQPNVYIFADGHYAITAVDGFAGRAFLAAAPTDAEAGRAFGPFMGQTGTYVSEDNQLSLSPLVAKDPALMDGATTLVHNLSWVGADVWLTSTSPTAGRTMTRLTPVDDQEAALSPEAQRLQGVWRRVEKVVDRGVEAGRHLDDVQPGYYIFTGDKFVANFVSAFAPRALLPDEPSVEEMGRAFSPYASFGGRFDFSDEGVLVFWPAVTMNPNNMRGRPFRSIETEWDGDDVWFIYNAADGAQNRTRLTRVSG